MDSVTFQGMPQDYILLAEHTGFDRGLKSSLCATALSGRSGMRCLTNTLAGKYGPPINGNYVVPYEGGSHSHCSDITKHAQSACGYSGHLSVKESDLTSALSGQGYEDALNDFKSLAGTTQYLVYNNYRRPQYSAAELQIDADALILQCLNQNRSNQVCQPHNNAANDNVTYLSAAANLVGNFGTPGQQSQWAAAAPACQEAAATKYWEYVAFDKDGAYVGTVDDLMQLVGSSSVSGACKAPPNPTPTKYAGVLTILAGTAAVAYLVMKYQK